VYAQNRLKLLIRIRLLLKLVSREDPKLMALAELTAVIGTCIFLITAATGVFVLLARSPINDQRDQSKVTDRRTLRRFATSEKVILSWCGTHDVTLTVKCRLIDISEYSVGVRSKLALGLGTHLSIKIPGRRLAATADVRRCAAAGRKFDLGLELRGPMYRTCT
jgi:hypothetical protein